MNATANGRCFSLPVVNPEAETPAGAAVRLLESGYWPIPVAGKSPIGSSWGKHRHTIESLKLAYLANPTAGVGLALGPGRAPGGRWLIDLEGDGDDSEESRQKLLGEWAGTTIGWTSRRGQHQLFVVDDARMRSTLEAFGSGAGGSGVLHLPELPGLELRVGGFMPDGTPKQLQSVCPPSVGEDGRPRVWVGGTEPVEAPTALYANLEAIARNRATPGGVTTDKPANDSWSLPVVRGGLVLDHYIDTAVSQEESRVATAANGTRNTVLNKAAYNLGRKAAYPGMQRVQVWHRLLGAALKVGLGESEAKRTIESGWAAGEASPCDLPTPRNSKAPTHNGTARVTKGPTVDGDYAGLSNDDLGIIDASTIEPRAIDWLWKHYIARGELSLLAGEGGLGKGLFGLWLAAALTTGGEKADGSGRFPDPAFTPPGKTVAILSAEDDPATILRPRLDALGADCKRVAFFTPRVTVREEGQPARRLMASLQDLGIWAERLRRNPQIRLLIIDGLPAQLGRGVNDSKNNEVRAVLESFIEAIVRPHRVAMLGITHLNKGADQRNANNRILGSVAYANLARNVHIVARDPDDPKRRLVLPSKRNNCPEDTPGLAFRIEPREIINADGEVIETAIPVFEDGPVVADINDVMGGGTSRHASGRPATVSPDLARWLVRFLLKQPDMTATGTTLFAAAGQEGLIGELREEKNGQVRWSKGRMLYRAADLVPSLDGDDAGCVIVRGEREGLRGNQVTWRLAAAGEEQP
jgi:hypothetical protein